MVVNFPFGSPQTENINLTENILEATLKEPSQDKVKVKLKCKFSYESVHNCNCFKVPVWNPSPTPKSKNVFVFFISEQIHSKEVSKCFY